MSNNLDRYVEAMQAAGVSREQAGYFLRGGYVALEAMLPFHVAARACDVRGGPVMVGLGGTRGPGKSHAALAQVGLDDCQRAAGLKALFLRKVQKSASESLEDLTYRVLAGVEFEYKTSLGRVQFGNGSRILLGGFRNESDIDKYLGLEYDLIAVEEATQLSEDKINKIRGSLRTSRDDWRPRMYLTTNPDGVGLQWFKRWIVEPWRNGEERTTRFIPASYMHNPFLNREYVEYLEGLGGPLGKAWRDGDWDAFEGMAFPTWRYETHVVEPFEIPEDWLTWRAVDEGYAAPWCCLWLAHDPLSGRRFVFREAYTAGLTVQQQARRILEMTMPGEEPYTTFADPAMWGRKNVGGVVLSAADEYGREGVALTKADNDRIQGKRRVDSALSALGDGRPGLQVFSTCANLIRTLPALVHSQVQPEDVDTTQEDHAYDALRYGLSNMRTSAEPEQAEELAAVEMAMARLGRIL